MDAAGRAVGFELNAWVRWRLPARSPCIARFAQWLLEETSGRPLSPLDDWHDGVLMLRYDHAAFCAADRTATGLAQVSLVDLLA